MSSRSGEIGKRSYPKGSRPSGHAGSSPASGMYQTLVVDPPWPMKTTRKRTASGNDKPGGWERLIGQVVALPYKVMTLDEIAALPVGDMAARAAHLYCWTTNRFLEQTFEIVRAWGFECSSVLTWCKPPMGLGFGGTYCNTTEFLLFARRGTLPALRRWDTTWFGLGRVYQNGRLAHSAKPEAFLDMVEAVSPGPYVELFARRARLGWDYWGDQSLGTAVMG